MNTIQQQIIYFITRASTIEKLTYWEQRIERVYGQVEECYRIAIDKRKSEINGSNHSTVHKG